MKFRNYLFIVSCTLTSPEGVEWNTFDSIDGSGTSSARNEYSLLDDFLYGNHSYYRLQQIDFDGMKIYSDVIVVESDFEKSFQVFPNPFGGQIDILLSEYQCNQSIVQGFLIQVELKSFNLKLNQGH